MNISPVTENDLESLAELYQQLLPNEISIPAMRKVLEKNRDNPNHMVIAAKIDGRLVGTLLAVVCEMLFGQCRSFMVIEDVVIDENNRRKGIGAAMIAYIEDYARKQDCSYIMLITDTDRKGSQTFYRSLGYQSDEFCAFKKKL